MQPDRVGVCSKALWDQLHELDWKTPVGFAVEQRAGIPDLCIGFNRNRGVYHFAMRRPVALSEQWDKPVGANDIKVEDRVPFLFSEWSTAIHGGPAPWVPLPPVIDAMVSHARSMWIPRTGLSGEDLVAATIDREEQLKAANLQTVTDFARSELKTHWRRHGQRRPPPKWNFIGAKRSYFGGTPIAAT